MQEMTAKNDIRRVDSLGRICIPSNLREKYGLISKVKFVENDGILSIMPVYEMNFSEEGTNMPSEDFVMFRSVV